MFVNSFYIKSIYIYRNYVRSLCCARLVTDMEQLPRKVDRRFTALISTLVVSAVVCFSIYLGSVRQQKSVGSSAVSTTSKVQTENYPNALAGLSMITVKGRAPKTGYSRSQFGGGWQKSGTCDTRNRILARDLTAVQYKTNTCLVESGDLADPYTGKLIRFIRGTETSSAVQIDHVVALSDAWQKGAQLLTPALREEFANDSLELLAVDGHTNQNKGDGDAATWLPPNKAFRCAYVARQVSVKIKYSLWITVAEKSVMQDILNQCPEEPLVK